MKIEELKQAPRCHYLLVWDKDRILILNCCETVEETDVVLALMTKDQYHEFSHMFRRLPRNINDARNMIHQYWQAKKNHSNDPLPCNYESYEEYIAAWEKEDEKVSEAFRRLYPNLHVDIFEDFKK